MSNKIPITLFIILLCCGLYLLPSCKPRGPQENNDIYLQVNLSNTLGLNWIYFKELNVRDLTTIDSFDVRKTGRHTFKFSPKGPGLYIVQSKPYNFITLLLEPGEKAELFADAGKMKKEYRIKGSPGSLILQEYFIHTDRNLQKIDSLKGVFEKARYSENYARLRNELDTAYYKVFKDQRNYVINLVKRNNKSIASIFLINQRFGPELIIKEKSDFPLFAAIDSCLMAVYPNNKHVIDHHQRVIEVKRTETELKLAEERIQNGKPAPDIKLTNQDNNPFSLSSIKGKTVLLYFWSAGTGKARQDHALMQPFYRTYKSRGLEIVSVSLDENKELWLSALKIDRLPWITLSDPGGAASPSARVYAVHETLPTYYLIDKQGNMAGHDRSFAAIKDLVLKTLSK